METTRPGIQLRLKCNHQPLTLMHHRSGGFDSRLQFGRMMRVVVDDANATDEPMIVPSTGYPGERRQSARDIVQIDAERATGRDACERVGNDMLAWNRHLNDADGALPHRQIKSRIFFVYFK